MVCVSTEKKKPVSRSRCQKSKPEKRRRRFSCPVQSCTGEVVNLKRHFVDVHADIPRFEAIELIKAGRQPAKRSYPKKRCCLKGCTWTGARPDIHLQIKHKISVSEALETAKQCEKIETKPNNNAENPQHVTTDKICDEFLTWFASLEGGSLVQPNLDENKKKHRTEK